MKLASKKIPPRRACTLGSIRAFLDYPQVVGAMIAALRKWNVVINLVRARIIFLAGFSLVFFDCAAAVRRWCTALALRAFDENDEPCQGSHDRSRANQIWNLQAEKICHRSNDDTSDEGYQPNSGLLFSSTDVVEGQQLDKDYGDGLLIRHLAGTKAILSMEFGVVNAARA